MIWQLAWVLLHDFKGEKRYNKKFDDLEIDAKKIAWRLYQKFYKENETSDFRFAKKIINLVSKWEKEYSPETIKIISGIFENFPYLEPDYKDFKNHFDNVLNEIETICTILKFDPKRHKN